MKKIDLSVVIPAYNEAVRLGANIGNVLNYLKKNYPNHELIVVNDGSTDNTAEIIKKYKDIKFISYDKNMGKGYAVRTGVAETIGEVVLFMDADLSTPLSEVDRILKLIKKYDVVIGSRDVEGSKIAKKPPFFRRLSSDIFDQVKYIMVGLRDLHDTQCGFKAFRGDVARKLFSMGIVNRFMFDVEILYLAEKLGYTIGEMPVTWADVPGSTVRFWEGIVNMFKDLWRIRFLHSKTLKL